MLKSKHTDKIGVAATAATLVITILFVMGGSFGLTAVAAQMPYIEKLFSIDRVHTLDIVVEEEDWQQMIENATAKEYIPITAVIDGEAFKNVGLRTKGNSTLSSVASSDSDRYSFKIEFDQYSDGNTYYGLDKLALNNIAQDNTYMKDFLSYQMMGGFGADAPLCSFIYITVNGEDWGLYLAVEGIEEAFAQRNYGSNYGQIYKPDSMDMAAGRSGDEERQMPEDMGGQRPQMPEEWLNEQETTTAQSGQETAEEETTGQAQPEETETQTELPEEENAAAGTMPFGQPPDGAGGMPPEGMEEGWMPPEGFTEGQAPPAMPEPEQAQTEQNGQQQAESQAPPESSQPAQEESGQTGEAEQEATETEQAAEPPGLSGMMGGGMGMMGGSSDVALLYTDDEQDSYPNIFDGAIFNPTDADKNRLIASIKQLNEGTNLEEVVNTDEVLRYFVVHNYLLNFDSYTGSMMHNYYLYEQDGQLSMIAWDYNLAFGSFGGGGGMGAGSGNEGATSLVNYPIDTPVSGTTLEDRPMLGQLLANEEYMAQYHTLFEAFLAQWFGEDDYLDNLIADTAALIAPYVEKDPTAFCSYEDFELGVQTLREFCQLRAQSVAGQLNGSIPSTSEGQSADSSGLVDASHVEVSTMGSQGMGGGSMGRPGQEAAGSEEATNNETAPGQAAAPQPEVAEQEVAEQIENTAATQAVAATQAENLSAAKTTSAAQQQEEAQSQADDTSTPAATPQQPAEQNWNGNQPPAGFGAAPGSGGTQTTQTTGLSAVVLVAVSAAVLGVGLVVVKVYK